MSKRRLLLADDSVTIQKVVNLTFADEGIEVVTVGDGDTAMLKFAEAAPDLVLADVNMPGLDGYQICEKIKQDAATRNIPVILLVGSFEPFDEEKAKRVGANDFLTKPFQSIRQLVNKVSDLLDAETNDEVFSSFNNDAVSSPVNSFDDTLDMEPPVIADSATVSPIDLGDAGMDDEMIHTAQIGSLPVDEAKKFESEPVDESFAENIDRTALRSPYSSESNTAEFEEGEDWGKTQPLSKTDLDEISTVTARAEIGRVVESPYEFDGRQEFAEEDITGDDEEEHFSLNKNKTAQIFSSSRTVSDLNFEDFDLLEFPQPKRRENFPEIDLSSDIQISNRDQNTGAQVSEQPVENLNADAQKMETLPPEMIEAIANRVVEKLSDKVIKQIVGEVIAQMERRK